MVLLDSWYTLVSNNEWTANTTSIWCNVNTTLKKHDFWVLAVLVHINNQINVARTWNKVQDTSSVVNACTNTISRSAQCHTNRNLFESFEQGKPSFESRDSKRKQIRPLFSGYWLPCQLTAGQDSQSASPISSISRTEWVPSNTTWFTLDSPRIW